MLTKKLEEPIKGSALQGSGRRVTAVKTLAVNAVMRNWIFVRVETDVPRLHDWGEATLEWKTRARPRPRDLEQSVRVVTKHGFWRLGVIGMPAISGIEVACCDIFGKSLDQPFGGSSAARRATTSRSTPILAWAR